MFKRSFVTALSLCMAFEVMAITAADAPAQYEQLQKWQFGGAVPVPAGGLTIQSDVASWTLASGSIRLMQPLASGEVTGLVFEGQGRFRMTIPDRVELAQLRRFAAKPELEQLEENFTQLVLRASDDTITKLVPGNDPNIGPSAVAGKRHEYWLAERGIDNDARVLAAMLHPKARRLVIAFKTDGFDWLTYDYDSLRAEEIQLVRDQARLAEIWLSLDRAEHRRPDGRPGEPQPPVAVIEHFDVKADLTRWGRSGIVGQSDQRTINGHYVIETVIAPLENGVSALELEFPSEAQKVTVREAGQELHYFRNPIGKRTIQLENDVFDNEITILFPEPLQRGQKRTIVFEFDLETANYAAGGYWYPSIPDDLTQRFTARLELTVRKKNEVRSMGRMESRREEGDRETSVWIVERPAKMITFSTAERFQEVKLDVDGIPPVVAFGPIFKLDNRDKVRNVGADVANSLQWFQAMLEDKVADTPHFYVTSIAAGHGQAFDGFLHMSDGTFAGEHPGASELFRAHEVAHEWWGHKVGWKTYRDQWLSEAFAEYSAMMFVHGFVKGGDRYFEEMLDSYEGILFGNLRGGFSKFSRPWLIEFNPADRARLGPIGHGRRARTKDMPAGYQIQAYHKGPMVLHMLRMLLRYRSGNDEVFLAVLREFVREYSGKAATTADFRRVLERKAPGDWGFFFDAWVDGAEIPSYRWSYSVAQAGDGGWTVTVHLKRSGVSEAFATAVPLRVDFDNKRAGYLILLNNQNEQSFTRKVPEKPKNVVFAPDHSLLALARKE